MLQSEQSAVTAERRVSLKVVGARLPICQPRFIKPPIVVDKQ